MQIRCERNDLSAGVKNHAANPSQACRVRQRSEELLGEMTTHHELYKQPKDG